VRSDHSSDRTVVPEASLEQTEHGLVPTGAGWFVLNARDARWRDRGQGGAYCGFEGEPQFEQIGINLVVLGPGQPMAMYHWEDDQEDFLVLRGEALLIVEGEERPLTQWDLVHCPPRTNHVIVGAGGAPCVILAVGGRAARRGRRAGDTLFGRGVCALPEIGAVRIPRRLASGLAGRTRSPGPATPTGLG
jgi:quercetin dioxygenase-like cupin family protein